VGATGAAAVSPYGATGIIGMSYNNNYTPIAPYTGLFGEVTMAHRYKLTGWQALASNGETGIFTTMISTSAYADYAPGTIGGTTGPWLNKMMKNTNSTLGVTGLQGDIVRVFATGCTGLSNVTATLNYYYW
jgi:hypothetical protein